MLVAEPTTLLKVAIEEMEVLYWQFIIDVLRRKLIRLTFADHVEFYI